MESPDICGPCICGQMIFNKDANSLFNEENWNEELGKLEINMQKNGVEPLPNTICKN